MDEGAAVPIEVLSGSDILEMCAAATVWMQRHVDSINAINVFPVPDGDTGTNMYLTMRSIMEEARRCPSDSAGEVLGAMARGGLMGARGNSGVILSQIIGGLARSVQGAKAVTPSGLVQGLEEASASSYKGVTRPVEGTMLTVIRETAEALRGALDQGETDIVALLDVAVEAARQSVANTPSLLPVLAEAGVVDAGGQGLYAILDAMARRLKGEVLEVAVVVGAGDIEQDWLVVTQQLHQREESLYGYCTEFLIGGRNLDPDALRDTILALGDSVLVVGDEHLVKVHLHTDDPGAALTSGSEVGSLHQVKVDNIREQAERFLEMHESRAPAVALPPEAISSVAVATGPGLVEVLRSVGASRVVEGGPTMKPSTRDILAAIETCQADDVVVLPNDKNVIMAAQQAADLAQKRVQVLSTPSVPQGIAALLALSQDLDLEANLQAMEEARRGVRTIEVSRATRSTSIREVKVRQGQAIAIVDDELKLATETPEEAVKAALDGLPMTEASLITLYYGEGTEEEQALALAEELRRLYPSHEAEVVHGGQPHYHYLVSVE
jgi:DAK2 domain fusion protein YloV